MKFVYFHPAQKQDGFSKKRPIDCLQENFYRSLLILSVGAEPASALNVNETAVSRALSNCNQGTSGLSPLCSSASNSQDVVALTPDQLFGMGSMATRVNGGSTTRPVSSYHFDQRKGHAGGAGDSDYSKLSFWGKVDSDFGTRHTTSKIHGFDFDNHNFNAGGDYRLSDSWLAGALFAYRHNTASFDLNRGETVNDSYTGGIYTTYQITDALHVEATATYGGYHYDTQRNINLVNLGPSTAKGSTNGGQYAFSWGGGYDFNYGALTIAPYARGEYINLDIDGYSESGSIGAVRFGKQNIESLVSTVGLQTAYTMSFSWGVLIPQLRGEWHHQYADGKRFISTSFVSDPTNQSFVMTGGLPTRDYYTFGAELTGVMPGGVSAFLVYESLQGYADIDSNKLMLGTRLEF